MTVRPVEFDLHTIEIQHPILRMDLPDSHMVRDRFCRGLYHQRVQIRRLRFPFLISFAEPYGVLHLQRRTACPLRAAGLPCRRSTLLARSACRHLIVRRDSVCCCPIRCQTALCRRLIYCRLAFCHQSAFPVEEATGLLR